MVSNEYAFNNVDSILCILCVRRIGCITGNKTKGKIMDWSTYITDLSIPKAWKYNGYHHDVLPSWYVNGFIIYIDSHLKSERLINSKEFNGCATLDNLNPRFTVFSDNYASGNTLDIPEELLATDNFTEVLNFVSIKDMWKKENKEWLM